MVYCHECGSEITENDTFCPFCGISLQSIPLSKDEESLVSENSMEISTDSFNDDFEESSLQSSIEESGFENTNDLQKDEEALDLTETVVIESEISLESKETQNDNEFIDISTLKDEADEQSENDFSSSKVASDNNEFDFNLEDYNDALEDVSSEIEKDSTNASEKSENNVDKEEFLTTDGLFDDDLEESETSVSEILEEKTEPEQLQSNEEIEVGLEEGLIVENINEKIENISFENVFEDEITDSTKDEFFAEKGVNEVDLPASIENQASVIDDSFETLMDDSDEVDKQDYSKEQIGDEKSLDALLNSREIEESEIDQVVSAIDSKVDSWKANENETSEEDLKDEAFTLINSSEVTNNTEDETLGEFLEKDKEEDSKKVNSDNEIENAVYIDSYSEEDIVQISSDQIEIENDVSQSGSNPNEEISQTTPNIGNADTDGSNVAKLKPLDEGVVLNGRYEIVRRIGGGGMGAVYLANDKNLGGVLRAVKEMVQSYIEEEQQIKAIQDFKRESMLLTSLEHSSIPTIYDYFLDEKEGRFYLVMKYISGGDLAARLRSAPEGKLDEISVTDWASQIADVLDYLHNRTPPIVYRDLKPANVMIDSNSNKVMLIDFGIARWVNKEEKGVTAVGTMGYAPPELFSGNVDQTSDIYSLGSTMFHLLTGADPQNNPLLIFDFQKHPRPRQINPNLSDQMERILMKAVEYSSVKRFSSAAEMRNVLQDHLANLKSGNVSFGVKETPTAVSLSDQPVFCGFCGQKIVATDMFCAFCGAKQPLAQPGVHSHEYKLTRTTTKLLIEGTSDLTYPAFELVKNENLVGRRDPMSNIFPEVDLSKFDPQTKISRKHARIWIEGDKYMLEDLGSSNGTYLIQTLKERIRLSPHQTQILANGDKIVLGDTVLQFVIA